MMVAPALKRRAILDELVANGVRITAQRRALLEVIQESQGHLDAVSLLHLARQREPASIARRYIARSSS